MMTNEEARKAIEKYQKEHPLQFGTMIDVTSISSKEGSDLISQIIEKVSKKVAEDTELWCICEMAKMYMQGVKPVYQTRPTGEWRVGSSLIACNLCDLILIKPSKLYNYCPNCGAYMKGGETVAENDLHHPGT